MMASTANATSTSNPSTSLQNSVSGHKDGSNKTTIKTTGGVKMNDRGRKESPVDIGRRSQQKAWTLGANPLTQRNATAVQANGSTTTSKASGGAKMPPQSQVGLSDKHAHDRLHFILAAAVGLSVTFTTKSGEKFEGIFAGSVPANNSTKITLKMTRKLQKNGHQINGVAAREAAFVGTSPEHAMTFDFKDMADLAIPEFTMPEVSRYVNGTGTSFQTDVDISGNTARGQRTLQRWEPEGPENNNDFSLESETSGQWDQFETHNQMFGNSSTYDENLYTTEIDRKAPGYKQREADAARIAREIEASVSTNAHVREERGQTSEQEHEDEESKYSGVRRDESSFAGLAIGGPNKYTPPARRAPTAAPSIPGAPFDSAIISAQLSKPDAPKATPAPSKAPSNKSPNPIEATRSLEHSDPASTIPATAESSAKLQPINVSLSPQTKPTANMSTESVENKVLDQFRQFANAERARLAERKRAQFNHDRTAKLNDLLRFSRTFKLKTPVPQDLVGILAKDPAKQEAIIEKAQKDHKEAKTAVVTTSASTSTSSATAATTVAPAAVAATTSASASTGSVKLPPVPKFDASQVPPPIPDRATFNRGRGGFLQTSGRGDRATQQNTPFAGRGAPPFPSRSSNVQERKNQVPAPIPLPDSRAPPVGPLADQPSVTSPQRSMMATPTSAVSTKMNARAIEFRPTAPAFNPPASSNAPSSPASVQRTNSVSRAASPSSFFGTRKPRPASERQQILANFNPIQRMQKEIEARKASDKSDEPVKDYPFNGGIPNAYHTGPVWTVKDENKDRSYTSAFERPAPSASPAQNRASSSQHLPYQGQLSASTNGTVPQISTPQHGPHTPHHYGHQFDEHRMQHIQGASPQVFASPSMTTRQLSNFSSPMSHQAQLAYGQPQYFAPNGQMPMAMRQYPNTPGAMHAQPGQMAAPMMMQQTSSGPYMAVPQGYNQMQMYSPSPAHVYPQQGNYPSPSRGAPMMMQQGSQQGHHGGQHMIYSMPGQNGPMMYGQQGQIGMVRGSYGTPQVSYGSSPHQSHHMQQRTMSSGYGHKSTPQVMQQNQGPPSNAPQQPAAYAQMDIGGEDNK